MFSVQTYLIEDVIVKNASPERKAQSEMLLKYREGMVTGDYGIGSVFPVNPENPTSAEELTLNAFYTLLLLGSDNTYNLLYGDMNNWLKDLVVARQKVKKEGMYDAYVEISKELDNQWKEYQSGEMELLNATPEKAWEEVVANARLGYKEYQQLHNDFTFRIAKEFLSQGVSRNLNKQFDIAFRKPGCASRPACQQIQFRKVESDMEKVLGYKTSWRTWCDGNKCPGSVDYVAEKASPAFASYFTRETGFSADVKNLDAFMRQYKAQDEIIKVFAEKGITLTRIKNLNRATFMKAYREAAFDKFGGDIVGLREGLNKAQFLKLPLMQQPFKTMMRGHYVGTVPLGLTKEQFYARYIKPKLNAEVQHEKKLMRKAISDFSENGRRELEGNAFLKAVIIPPIALFFSLFFSLFSLARLPLRFLEMSQLKKPEARKVKFKRILTILDLCAILAIPTVIASNSGFTSDEAMKRFEILRGDPLPLIQALSYKWVMGIEPIIYPIGSAILEIGNMNNIDHPLYD